MMTIFRTFTLLAALFTILLAGFMFQPSANAAQKTDYAYFSGGCFWCTEHDFEKINGVTDVMSGYMGGHIKNPKYKQVSSGRSGHYEIVRVSFDPRKTSYQTLLSAFWRMHDPSDGAGSFCDRGQQYSTAIFYATDEQKKLSLGAIKALNAAHKFASPIATKILPLSDFTKAESYHQDYASRNPLRYKYYRHRCGRDQFIETHWQGDNTLYQSVR